MAAFSPEWAVKFEREKPALSAALAPHSHRIEHIGSTAVPGAIAKPIIDIAILLDSVALIPSLVPPLAGLGYEHLGEFGLPGRHFFVKGDPRSFHLHLVDSTTDHWQRWIRFRDILRGNPAILREYEELKVSLAQKYFEDREKYTAAKSTFVNAILERKL
jgi:GrpB-like predicted nucleotidyltransferase (UPF0157 family)